AIRAEVIRQIQQAPQEADAVILDAALMLEAGWADVCQHLIFIDTPRALRESRVKAGRGWSADELQRREASQWDIDLKRRQADYVVENSDDLASASDRLEKVLRMLIRP
ncbi:MAG: dephospho-CoA kinase, partial [Planctomycetaceae bacterium]|nr:dephospho-CoA kinase [Planctomycetaceae bacterium]